MPTLPAVVEIVGRLPPPFETEIRRETEVEVDPFDLVAQAVVRRDLKRALRRQGVRITSCTMIFETAPDRWLCVSVWSRGE